MATAGNYWQKMAFGGQLYEVYVIIKPIDSDDSVKELVFPRTSLEGEIDNQVGSETLVDELGIMASWSYSMETTVTLKLKPMKNETGSLYMFKDHAKPQPVDIMDM